MIAGFRDASEILRIVFNALRWPVQLLVVPLRTVYELLVSTFSRELIFGKDERWKMRNTILNLYMKSTDAVNRTAGKAGYSSTNEVLKDNAESDNGRVWFGNRR